jgi:hypothetical protein
MALDLVVEVDERAAELGGDGTTERRLARGGEADQEKRSGSHPWRVLDGVTGRPVQRPG